MSEKNEKGRKAGMRNAGAGRAKKFQPEHKKSARRWFSLDSLMGKALCVLLVVILTVGAFLAPKLINNLYDAGTLMEIAYMDMDLSPYAVPYTTFQDKIMALARAKTAGMRLTALPAEEAADKISDEELIEIVNEEMETVGNSMDVLFRESWWDAQTADNLVSREKHTVYMSAPAGEEDVSREMTPFQVWMLTFEVTGQQDKLVIYEGDEKRVLSQFATDRLIVCMDADFYKIIAIAMRGERYKTNELYGWDMIYPFGVGLDAPADVQNIAAQKYGNSGHMNEMQIYVTDRIRQEWVDYWDITIKDYLYEIDSEGTLGVYLFFEDKAAAMQTGDFGLTEASDTIVENGTDTAAASGVKMYADPDGDGVAEVYDTDAEAFEEERKAREARAKAIEWDLKMQEAEAAGYPDVVAPAIEAGVTFLEAAGRVEWEETGDSIWILKSGCTEFFEMMQF